MTAITGGAGTGKSSLMQEAAEAIRANSKELHVFAPSTGSREVLEEKGFKNAQTVEHLLKNEKLHPKLKDQVLWVDEGGLLDVRSMNGIFKIVQEQNARLILSGDSRQHSSPRRGEAMRILEQEAGLNVARVEAIQRQQGRYKKAVELISQGHRIVNEKSKKTGILAGFDLLDRMGKIKEVPSSDRHEELAKRYVKSKNAKHTPLVVAPTHAEGRKLTEDIRTRLREKGAIGKESRKFGQLLSLNLSEAEKSTRTAYEQQGMVVQFHQNVKGGFKRGERYRVCRSKQGKPMLSPLAGGRLKQIPHDAASRFEVYQESTAEFSIGDKIRFSLGGKAEDGKRRISNGRLDEIQKFDKQGNIKLKSGMTVSRDYGHWDLGYVVTSHASQGKDRQLAMAAIGSQSLPAVNAKQFYVTVSRGSKDVAIYVDDKKAVRRAIQRAGTQLSATELTCGQPTPQRRQAMNQQTQRRAYFDRVRIWWQTRFPKREAATARATKPSMGMQTTPAPSRS